MTNPTHAWFQSQSPADMVRMIGGADGPQRENLERWVNECRREDGHPEWVDSPIDDGIIEEWTKYPPLLNFKLGCSLLRCCVPPPRTCPACEGSGMKSHTDAAGDTDAEPCKRCGGRLEVDGYFRGCGLVCEPPVIDPRWLSGTVLGLVEQIVNRGKCGCTEARIDFKKESSPVICGNCNSQIRMHPDFSIMPILADALEDAGADDKAMLAHLRDDPVHCGECWAVEALTKAMKGE